jgi:hypothetical protein
LKRKVLLKNQKHQPNIVEITHLCIMHRVHTSMLYIDKTTPRIVKKKKLRKCNLIMGSEDAVLNCQSKI